MKVARCDCEHIPAGTVFFPPNCDRYAEALALFEAPSCQDPDCGRIAIAPGFFCKVHGCVQCGHVIAADYEAGRLCFDCGDKPLAVLGGVE